MQQLTFIKKQTLEWRDAPEPELCGPKEALVRPFIAARCDGDVLPLFHNITKPLRLGMAVHFLDPLVADLLGDKPYQGPFAFGHECIAEVLECGDQVSSVNKGDQVIVPWSISCGHCFQCRHGLTSRCLESGETLLSAYGFGSAMGPWGGAVSERMRVPFADAMLVKVPHGMDPLPIASASDNLPDAWRTVAPHLERYPQAPVLVVGGGARSIGLYAAGLAVALGSSQVDYLDYSPSRLGIAENLGANAIHIPRGSKWLRRNAARVNGEHLISVDASASSAGLNYALRALSPGGFCTGVGYYFGKSTGLPVMQMFTNASTLHIGVSNPRADLPQLLQCLQTTGFRPQLVTTLAAHWDDAPNAFLERTTKVVIHRDPILT